MCGFTPALSHQLGGKTMFLFFPSIIGQLPFWPTSVLCWHAYNRNVNGSVCACTAKKVASSIPQPGALCVECLLGAPAASHSWNAMCVSVDCLWAWIQMSFCFCFFLYLNGPVINWNLVQSVAPLPSRDSSWGRPQKPSDADCRRSSDRKWRDCVAPAWSGLWPQCFHIVSLSHI